MGEDCRDDVLTYIGLGAGDGGPALASLLYVGQTGLRTPPTHVIPGLEEGDLQPEAGEAHVVPGPGRAGDTAEGDTGGHYQALRERGAYFVLPSWTSWQ